MRTCKNFHKEHKEQRTLPLILNFIVESMRTTLYFAHTIIVRCIIPSLIWSIQQMYYECYEPLFGKIYYVLLGELQTLNIIKF